MVRLSEDTAAEVPHTQHETDSRISTGIHQRPEPLPQPPGPSLSSVAAWPLLTDGCPRRPAGVEAGSGHASAGPGWSSAQTAAMIVLQEQPGAG